MKNKLQMLIDLVKANKYLAQEYFLQHIFDNSKEIIIKITDKMEK